MLTTRSVTRASALMNIHGKNVHALISPDHLTQGWIDSNLSVCGPAMPGFGPKAPLRLSASCGQSHTPLPQRIRDFVYCVKPGRVHERNGQHVQYEPLQGWAGSVRGCNHPAFEERRIEKHNGCIETQER